MLFAKIDLNEKLKFGTFIQKLLANRLITHFIWSCETVCTMKNILLVQSTWFLWKGLRKKSRCKLWASFPEQTFTIGRCLSVVVVNLENNVGRIGSQKRSLTFWIRSIRIFEKANWSRKTETNPTMFFFLAND